MTSNDQQNLISHLSVLYESASQFASETAFLIPMKEMENKHKILAGIQSPMSSF